MGAGTTKARISQLPIFAVLSFDGRPFDAVFSLIGMQRSINCDSFQ